tara:strand:+ start:205 stop:348 length:144 start_codon:yes stop_codon:yes gene_type:complete
MTIVFGVEENFVGSRFDSTKGRFDSTKGHFDSTKSGDGTNGCGFLKM